MNRIVEAEVKIRVRFSESDAMGVVWHGNYLKFFEDGRERLGELYEMTYLDISGAGYFIPIVKLECKYLAPITFGQRIKVLCRLIETKAAKITHTYEVWNLETDELSCKGRTEQIFLSSETNEMSLSYPEFYSNWKSGLPWKEV